LKVPDSIRKTVAFIAYRDQVSGNLRPVGSVFFVGPDAPDGSPVLPRVFMATARHVIEALRSKGCTSTVVRLNAIEGESPSLMSIEVPINDWQFDPDDPSVDVAVVERGIPADADHLVIPFSLGATKERLAENDVDLGDEVFISGLFAHHYGTGRNIPIIRVGNLAALDEEKISTRAFGDIEAYLIEARSIGGLSGSPVFVNLGGFRPVNGTVNIGTGGGVLLLGLIHGHFDVQSEPTPNAAEEDAGLKNEAVNAGIAIVVPFHAIATTVAKYKRAPPFTFSFGSYSGGG
jgi:hypothetical protein